ncbi:MAG: hypothetical protein ACOX6J_00915 [Oscillospiraceae bacterium]|jgi:hypothetical protein
MTELPFITVAGHYGGDQRRFPRAMMRLGGCSTVCACHAAMLIAAFDSSRKDLCPIEGLDVTRKDFNAFGVEMFKYVYPGIRGMPETGMFRDSFSKYADSRGVRVCYSELSGRASYSEAEAFVRNALAESKYIQYLLLNHKNPAFSDIEWHWFTVTGMTDDGRIIFSSFGERCEADLALLWDTGCREKGGMIIVE